MVARCAQEGLDVCRSALVVSRLPGSIRVRASCIGSFAWQPGVPASPSVSAFIRCGTASPRILLEQKTDIRIIQVLLGHKKLDTTALYTRVAISTIGQVTSPLDFLRQMRG